MKSVNVNAFHLFNCFEESVRELHIFLEPAVLFFGLQFQ